MDYFLRYLVVAAWLVYAEATIPDGPCFQFPGDSYVHFTPNNFDNHNEIHYRLQFSTQQANGILMFAVGPAGDEEALYIRDGFLCYHIFNPASSGIESSFGGHFVIPEAVNIDDWITVHVYRNWHMRDTRRQRRYNQTGIVATINGETFTQVDDYTRTGINLLPTVYFGGYKEAVSSTVGRFVGKIRKMSEEKNDVIFETPSLNYESKVITPCQD